MVLMHSAVYGMRTDLIACDFAPSQCDLSTRLRDGIEKQRNFIPGGVFCPTHLQAIYGTKINQYDYSKQNISRKK